ncbi:8-amino-7-oxononanoate synthase [Rubidibacter lacunae KORDI 51-2]|uniref:8-amino-7-ketopelargonate synthase n=1 Tax=Rubidibacter lacunae KORDI 51-2 TaxID=582515 RepID=U5DPH4_9CHRO|nr:8-amino-7-oxononanoate synthase [Rubidibacter lacunae]ERN42504.1 8-amino-7-oxononanoate synthase [Rubidibacter lacunae KORDI 51-2]
MHDSLPARHNDPYDWLPPALETIRRAHWHRSVQPLQGRPGPRVHLNGRTQINFASNDYLGLAGDERLVQAAIAATQEFGTGSTGSRLLSGHRELHRELERALAELKQTDDAIVFSSGYLANLGTIAALVGPRDLILSDQYNHSSLQAGARLSGATLVSYRHGDPADLTARLQEHRDRARRCLIATDSVFSMDGDLCPLPDILELADAWDCMVAIDDAHATGILGTTGAGCAEHFGCRDRPLIQIGTLSKALGSLGGYVAGSAALVDFLRNRASSWIYTTALSPADAAAALAALYVLRAEPQRRDRLWQNTACLARELHGLDMLPSESPIRCIRLARAETALALARDLQAAGIFAPAIRPPTVPTSRIRLSVMATHTPEQISQAGTLLRKLCAGS